MPPEYSPIQRSMASNSTSVESSSMRCATSLLVSPYKAPCSWRISRPLCLSSSEASCSAAPMRNRISLAPLTTSWPSTVARPEVGVSSVVSILTTVDLPAPLGPRNP